MNLIESNWIFNENMILLNGYWIKIMNFYFSGCFSLFIGMKYLCIDVYTWILLKVIGFANDDMLLLNGYWIKIMNFILV